MDELKRVYVVPLRRKTLKAPKWRRSKKALCILKEFVKKHMKCENLVVLNEVNEFIWENGIKNPPGKIEINVLKKTENDKTKVYVALKESTLDELFKVKEEEKEKQTETKNENVKDKKEEKVVEAKEVEKKVEKEEVKEDTQAKEEKQNINKNESSKKVKEDKK